MHIVRYIQDNLKPNGMVDNCEFLKNLYLQQSIHITHERIIKINCDTKSEHCFSSYPQYLDDSSSKYFAKCANDGKS